MKLRLLLFLMAFVAGNMLAQEKKVTVAVLDFRTHTIMKREEVVALTNKFRASLGETKKFTLLERSDMEAILKEQEFSLSDVCNTAECAVQVGQLLAAEKIITGDLGKVGQSYTVTVRIIDVSTGKVEQTASEEYKGASEGLIKTFDVLAQKLTGIYRKNNTFWYVLGGAAIAGSSAAAAVLLLGGKSGTGNKVGNPPGTPQVP
jgi:TolB-like protein